MLGSPRRITAENDSWLAEAGSPVSQSWLSRKWGSKLEGRWWRGGTGGWSWGLKIIFPGCLQKDRSVRSVTRQLLTWEGRYLLLFLPFSQKLALLIFTKMSKIKGRKRHILKEKYNISRWYGLSEPTNLSSGFLQGSQYRPWWAPPVWETLPPAGPFENVSGLCPSNPVLVP